MFKIELTAKYHIYKWQLLLHNKNRLNIQHVILHECDSDYNGEPFIHEGDCITNPLKTKHCRNAGLIWSRGSDEVNICFNLKLFT